MKRLNTSLALLLLITAIPAVAYRILEAPDLRDRLDLLGYFTIQSNILVILIVVLSLIAVKISAEVKLSVAVAISITAIIYQLFLRQTWEPRGLSAIVTNINHGSTTVLYLLWFWTDPTGTSLPYKRLWTVIPYPAAYCLFGIYEAFNRVRPIRYFFLDIRNTGWDGFALWFAGLTVLFLGTGALILSIRRRIPVNSR